MMKSFFKKLAFVMALAMVVSMVAPAAQTAVAAEDKALAIAYQKGAVITALNLTEVGATEDLRFVYAPENWKELNPTWTSSNPNVVSVDQNGVVKAEAAGTATVTVAVGTETAEVEVYSVDTTTFVATMGDAEDRARTELTLTVGDDFDFAFYGIKDYSVDRYRCEWFAVDPEGVLDFDDTNGKLVAKKAGTAKISLLVGNYITGIKTEVAPCTVTVVDETPVVDNSFAVKQLNSDTVEVTFAKKDITDKEISLKASSVNALFANDDEYIKVSAVKDGVVTVKFYNGLNAGYTYTLINGEESVTFDASTGVVDKIVISYECCKTPGVAYAGQTVFLSAKVYSGDVEVTANNGVTFKHSSSIFGSETLGAAFYAMQAGEVVAVTASYYNTGATEPVTATIAIPVSALPEYRMKNSDAAMEIKGADAAYNGKGTDKISTSDLGKYMVFKTKDNYGNTIKGYALTNTFQAGAATSYGVFRFTTTNDTILGVSETSGALYPRSAGSAVIQVWFVHSTTGTKTLVGSKQVTVYGPRALATYTLTKTASPNMASTTPSVYASIASQAGADFYNKATFTFTTKDQLGDAFRAGAYTKILNDNDAAYVDGIDISHKSDDSEVYFTVTASGYMAANEQWRDVEIRLFGSDKNYLDVIVRIFNTNAGTDYAKKANAHSAFLHSSSARGLGVIDATTARVVTAGVVKYGNNAYQVADKIGGPFSDIELIVKQANEIKKNHLTNSQNLTAAEEAVISQATAIATGGAWYYKVKNTKSGADVSASAAWNKTANTVSYTLRDAVANVADTTYILDYSKAANHVDQKKVTVDMDVYTETKDGNGVEFTFYQVYYNQYTSRYEYKTFTTSKWLTNDDRAKIGGSVEVLTNSAAGNTDVYDLDTFVLNCIAVSVNDPDNGGLTLCNNTDYGSAWNTTKFQLKGVVTNGTGFYGNTYVDSQTVNNWAYIVSLLVTYTNGDEVVTVEIPVNTRVEW